MLMQALIISAGAINAGGIGYAPFVFGIAASVPMRAVAATKSDGALTALVVPSGYPARTVAHLAGRRVATLTG